MSLNAFRWGLVLVALGFIIGRLLMLTDHLTLVYPPHDEPIVAYNPGPPLDFPIPPKSRMKDPCQQTGIICYEGLTINGEASHIDVCNNGKWERVK